MGAPNVTNILKSNAVLWCAPAGETLPDETTIEYGDDWGGNWVRVGYTKEPLTLGVEDERTKFQMEEEISGLDERRIGFYVAIETVLGEITAEYMSWLTEGTASTTGAGAGQAAYEELDFGEEAVITKRVWGFEGLYIDEDAVSEPVRFFMIRGTAKLNGNLEWSQRSDEVTGIGLRVEALGSPGNSPIKYQKVLSLYALQLLQGGLMQLIDGEYLELEGA